MSKKQLKKTITGSLSLDKEMETCIKGLSNLKLTENRYDNLEIPEGMTKIELGFESFYDVYEKDGEIYFLIDHGYGAQFIKREVLLAYLQQFVLQESDV